LVKLSKFFQDVSVHIMGLGGSQMFAIEYIAFAHYPPRSETSHNGGLVDLHLSETHESHALTYMADCHSIYSMRWLLRRWQIPRMCCTCGFLYRHVEALS